VGMPASADGSSIAVSTDSNGKVAPGSMPATAAEPPADGNGSAAAGLQAIATAVAEQAAAAGKQAAAGEQGLGALLSTMHCCLCIHNSQRQCLSRAGKSTQLSLPSLCAPCAVASDAAQRARAELQARLPEWKAWAEEHPGRQATMCPCCIASCCPCCCCL
jgi:hypothetical protein